jgi:hypothetical protein
VTFQRADNSTYDRVGGKVQEKAAGHTTPFEAFTYGTPEEKQAAQNFLDLEKRLGRKYERPERPSDVEERYRLYQEDPDAYTAMFGDKTGGKADAATATKMLNYFDRRRREVNGDFTLDDDEKKKQLDDIDNLAKPFMEAVQPGSRARGDDRVTVTHPDGRVGTIPRSQLEKAKKKGFREAAQQ